MPTEEVNRGLFDKAVEATETIRLIVANMQRIDEEVARAEKHISELFNRVKELNKSLEVIIESSRNVEEVSDKGPDVVTETKEDESTPNSQDNMSESVSNEKQTVKPEISDTRLYEPDKKVDALKEKTLDTICVFGRKYKGLTFREILNREGGEDFVRRLAKSQSMLAEDCAYLVKCLEEEEE